MTTPNNDYLNVQIPTCEQLEPEKEKAKMIGNQLTTIQNNQSRIVTKVCTVLHETFLLFILQHFSNLFYSVDI